MGRRSAGRAVVEWLRRMPALVLALYLLPTILIPAVHVVAELLEESGCVACSSSEPEQARASFQDTSRPDAPCHDPTHRHHNHAPHDAAQCAICSSVSHALFDLPVSGPTVTFEPGLGSSLLVPAPVVPGRETLLLELARGPPAA